jgi:hypothetical protein
MNFLRLFTFIALMIAILLAGSCAPNMASNGGIYLRNLSKGPVSAILRAEHGDSRWKQIEAGEKQVVGVFLKTNETGTVEVTDATGKSHMFPVKADGNSGADITIDFP